MARPTQRQIAEKLGLSTATVSLALRDSPMIAEDTRRIVKEAMRETGYVLNASAAALRTGRSNIVGVSFHNIAHQFFAEMLIAIEEKLGAAGIAVFLNNHGEDAASLSRFVASLAAYGADGLLVSPPAAATRETLEPIRKLGAPVVYVSRRLLGDDAADWVVNADRRAMREATRRLIELGHKRIALIGGEPGTTVSDERFTGFCEEMQAAGLTWNKSVWRQCRPRLAEGSRAVQALLDEDGEKPTGFVCFNDLIAFGVMNGLRSRGVCPGKDVGVVGLGGTDEAAASWPALTTVLDNPAEIGELAAGILLDRLEKPEKPPQHITLNPQLVVRESCGGQVGG